MGLSEPIEERKVVETKLNGRVLPHIPEKFADLHISAYFDN
jgi:hypothetical protein